MPRILLIGQAPGLNGSDRPTGRSPGRRATASGPGSRPGGIPRDDFWRKIHFAAVTRCYPGRSPGSQGGPPPGPAERALCRPWLDEVVAPDRARDRAPASASWRSGRSSGPVPSLSAVVGTARVVEGVRYLPLPHPSGVSRWLNDPPNIEAVARAMVLLRGWVDELEI